MTLITVFTPTYNRAYVLPRLYDSLCEQTSIDFEWIVIDDGSTDNTKELVEQWLEEAPFTIIFKRVDNGGKHRAINKGVNLANADAFFIVDSDDYLLPEAVEKVNRWFSEIAADDSFAGVSGLRGKIGHDNEPVGGFGNFKGPYIDCTDIDRGGI